MIARALLVRHGESTWNAVRRWQGQADPPLSERGEQQAIEAVAAARSLEPFSTVVTSTLRRARRTGELLADGLVCALGASIRDIAERAAGEWEGLTRVEINDRYPGFLDDNRRPTGYEADTDVVLRSTSALTSLGAEHAGGTLLVVSHGGVINALEQAGGEGWLRLDNLEGRWFDIGHDHVTPVGTRVHLLAPAPPESPEDPTDRSYA